MNRRSVSNSGSISQHQKHIKLLDIQFLSRISKFLDIHFYLSKTIRTALPLVLLLNFPFNKKIRLHTCKSILIQGKPLNSLFPDNLFDIVFDKIEICLMSFLVINLGSDNSKLSHILSIDDSMFRICEF